MSVAATREARQIGSRLAQKPVQTTLPAGVMPKRLERPPTGRRAVCSGAVSDQAARLWWW